MTNELPNLTDSSTALANRYLILSLTESWLGKEDVELEGRILPELPQILLWALKGLARLRQRKRFIQPASAQQHLDDLFEMTSPINVFVKECCKVGPSHIIEIQELYDAWVKWCYESGEKPGTKNVFGRCLRTVVPKIKTMQLRDKGDKEPHSNRGASKRYHQLMWHCPPFIFTW